MLKKLALTCSNPAELAARSGGAIWRRDLAARSGELAARSGGAIWRTGGVIWRRDLAKKLLEKAKKEAAE